MITGIIGLPGTSKSYNLINKGFARAEELKRYIVANFPIDEVAAARYCTLKGYKWLAEQFRAGRWEYVPDDVGRLISYAGSVILLDEAGIFLTARDYAKIPKEVIINLCQARKIGSDLYWTSQHEDLVYVNLRKVTNFFLCADFVSGEIVKKWQWEGLSFTFRIPSLRILWKFDEAGLAGFRRSRKGLKHALHMPEVYGFDPRVFWVFDSNVRLEDSGFTGHKVRDREQKREDLDIERRRLAVGGLIGVRTAPIGAAG